MKEYFVYILECENGAYYTGICTNPAKRYAAHRDGRGAKYTRAFAPIAMRLLLAVAGARAEAQRLEHAIKRLTRSEKDRLIDTAHRQGILLEVCKEVAASILDATKIE